MADMVNGIFFKTPHDNAPDWVKRKVSVNVEQFIQYLQENANEKGYVNFDLNEARSGHWYLQKDDWKPDGQKAEQSSRPAHQEHTGTPFQSYKPGPKPTDFNSGGGKARFEDDIPFSYHRD